MATDERNVVPYVFRASNDYISGAAEEGNLLDSYIEFYIEFEAIGRETLALRLEIDGCWKKRI